MEPFSKEGLVDAFRELSRELRRSRVRGHIYVIDGAAMALGFDDRRHTMDVDVLIKEGHGTVVGAVGRVALRRGWPESWLNEAASSAMPARIDGRARTVYGDRQLVVTSASAEHLLAMMVRAARPKDAKDIAFLARHLRMSSAREVFDLHDEVFPDAPPQLRNYTASRAILRNLWPHDTSMARDDRYAYGRAAEGPATGPPR